MDKGAKSPMGKIVFEIPTTFSDSDKLRERKLKEIQDQFLSDFHQSQRHSSHSSSNSTSEVIKVPPTQLRTALNKLVFDNSRREKTLEELKAISLGMTKNAERGRDAALSYSVGGRGDEPTSPLGTVPLTPRSVIPALQALIVKTLTKVETEEFTCEQLTRLWEKTNLTLVFHTQAELKQRIERLRVVHRKLFAKMDEIVTMKINANNKMYQASHSLAKMEWEVSEGRTRREHKVETMRWKIEDTEYEYKRISKELAQRVLRDQVGPTQEADERNEELLQGVAAAAAIHAAQKVQNLKSARALESIEAAFTRIRNLINHSSFFSLKTPLASLSLEETLKYFSQLSYQVLSLNNKFASLSETESGLVLTLKQLTSELDTLKLNNSHLGRAISHINSIWTHLGHEPLTTASQFKHALETLSIEPNSGELEDGLETFLVTVNLSGVEVCRRLITLLQYIEQHSTSHLTGVEASMSRLTQLVGQVVTPTSKPPPAAFTDTQQPKKLRPPPVRKGTTFLSTIRQPISLSPAVPRSVSEMELDGTPRSQASDKGQISMTEDTYREMLNESSGLDEEEIEEVLKAISHIHLIRLFLTKAKFRSITIPSRYVHTDDPALSLVSSLLAESHTALRDLYSKRTSSLESLLSSILFDSASLSRQFSSIPMTESQLMQFLSDRQDLQRIAEGFESGERHQLSEATKAILEVKMKTLSTQQLRRNSVLKALDVTSDSSKAKIDPVFQTQEDNDQEEIVPCYVGGNTGAEEQVQVTYCFFQQWGEGPQAGTGGNARSED